MSSPGDPNPLPCGHKGERDCPPQPAVITAEPVAEKSTGTEEKSSIWDRIPTDPVAAEPSADDL